MNQLDNVMSIITITVYKAIRKIITKMDFQYQLDVTKRDK